MNSYDKEFKMVQSMLEELSRAREIMEELQDGIVTIENELNRLDAALPGDAVISAMPDSSEKQQLLQLLDLMGEAYNKVDEMLGAPEDEVTGQPLGTAFSPEARGNSANDLSLEEMMRQIQHFRSKTAS